MDFAAVEIIDAPGARHAPPNPTPWVSLAEHLRLMLLGRQRQNAHQNFCVWGLSPVLFFFLRELSGSVVGGWLRLVSLLLQCRARNLPRLPIVCSALCNTPFLPYPSGYLEPVLHAGYRGKSEFQVAR